MFGTLELLSLDAALAKGAARREIETAEGLFMLLD
jgi:hypothetical protein